MILATGLVVFWGGLRLYESLLDDETKVLRLIAGQAEAFNSCSLDGMDGFHPEFRDRSAKVDRAQLQAILRYLFHRVKRPKDNQFPYRIDLPPEDTVVDQLDPQEGTAAVTFRAILHEGIGDEAKQTWEVEIEAELMRDPRKGWQFRRSAHRTLSGARPR